MSGNFIDQLSAFPPSGPVFGLDLGTKTIGIAVSNPERSLATPVTTIRRKKFTQDAEAMLALATERRVTGIILGLPINMDGTEGPRAQATRAFARNLARLSDLPVAFWDERLSTAAAEREMIALDTSRARRAETIDEMAATYILQGALDRMKSR
ncbi:Holliday junction resolvase RuvX [Parvularcula flava]|uniref:Putative pre-16S rRNA nuclease n=1 Tax=Aquisalinus luteolus TaxID=1566827 RepID=A0A8J3EP79_9PROT|nr:Holliday junction resolvase RuvX [Aquisalinus luteolus]NHK27375.1 Holliday junction resolvase RuvX [Aquisalinus luteolus]GGH95246.1 putative pre-16S rRNA nuclease [Aquisalinus luteolus]